MNSFPSVAIVMPVLNEEEHLESAIQRLLAQDYQGDMVIVLAVAPSRDRTEAIAADLAQRHPSLRVVANPSGKTPSALNAAIGVSTSEVVVRVDGHALIPSDYIRIGVETLNRSGADNVGGVMAATGLTPMQKAIAAAMTSKFGVGGAAFHVGGAEGEALTVYLGCFRRTALERVGGYDESMVRAQDWEMNHRIRETGGKVWFTPEMVVTYRPRSSLRELARQYFGYGTWRREVARRYRETISLRYLAAPVLVIGLLLGLLLILIGGLASLKFLVWIGLIPLVAYLLGVFGASVISRAGTSGLLLPIVFPVMHISWGLGFLFGRAKS
jgi:cellulose synthase/poly-beta-1,6-N-acetylglucosamine synthase-like glycosyltransferase